MFPWIKQLDEQDCGPTCLAIVNRYYGRRTSVTTIREMAGTDRDGTNLLGMTEAAEELGFWAKAYYGDADSLIQPGLLPMIAHMQIEDLLHYVVVYRVTAQRVWISDPARRKHSVKRSLFLEQWTGHCIVLAPADNFRRQADHAGPLGRFVPLLKAQASTLIEAFVASFVLVAFGIAHFLYVRFLVDNVIPGGLVRALAATTVAMAAIVIAKSLLEALRSYLLAHAGNRIDMQIVFAYISHLLRLPMSFFDRRRIGEVMTRLDDVEAIRQVLSGVSLSAAMDIVLIIAVGAFLLSQSVVLTVVAIAPVVPAVTLTLLMIRPYEKNYNLSASLEARSQSHLTEVLTNMFTVKALNAEDVAFYQGELRLVAALRQDFRLEFMAIAQKAAIDFVEGFGQVGLYAIGTWLILKDRLTLGQLISFSALSSYLTGALQNLFTTQPALQSAAVAARRIGEVLDLEPESTSPTNSPAGNGIEGRIEFDGVRFRYGKRRDVLGGVSFSVEPGEYVGIVGPTGSGKSTIVKLLLKLYLSTDGAISIDGVDIRDISTHFIRDVVGYVPQDVALFQGSIRENIAYRVPDARFEDVLRAAIQAQAHPFIANLPERYDTPVGERGTALSGGEKQRIALARALLGSPRILILDEATSALDTVTEQAVQQTLEGLRSEGVTILHIAHRLTTIRRCSRILVMNDGRLVETGTHEDLLGTGGWYEQLWARQIPEPS